MRHYSLQDSEYRRTIDLRSYKKIIEDAVHSVTPITKVTVNKDYYTVEPVPSKGDLIKIGRILAKSEYLGQYCITRPLLFKGEEVDETNNKTNQKGKSDIEQKDIEKPKKKGRCR